LIVRRRILIYAFLALAVPLPALALTGRGGGEQPPPDVSLSVAASLDSCGTAADTIVCKIDVSWNAVPGANRYTASVTRADGSVVDFGDVGAGSASFWVPYVGNGTYTVSVSAYGTPPGEDKPEVLDRDTVDAGSDEGAGAKDETAPDAPGPAAIGGDTVDADPVDEGPGPEPPATDPEKPNCDDPDEPTPPEEPPTAEPSSEPGLGNDPGKAALSPEAESALDDSAELPGAVDCPAPEAPG
jgi:hypothetical protein